MTAGVRQSTNMSVLIEELWELVGDVPGPFEDKVRRAREIESELQQLTLSPYAREKVGDVFSWLRMWFRPNVWRQYGATPDSLRDNVLTSVAKLRGALR